MRFVGSLFILSFLLHATLFATCQGAFPGALSSTNDEIQINTDTKINGTTNHTLITKILTTSSGVECDSAPCIKSDTLADTLTFTLDTGSGGDGDLILNDGVTTTLSSDKAYSKVQFGKNSVLNLNGDITIRSQSDVQFNTGSEINVTGNVVIYADKFDANQGCKFNINGSLTIIVDTFYLNSGNILQNIPSAEDFVVKAKSIIDINSQVEFKGLFYSAGDVQVNDHTTITGAMTGNYIDVNNNALIGYDAGAVNSYCGSGATASISGTIFEDFSGDGLADGDTGINDSSGDQQSKHGTTVYLYKDNGDNTLDSSDTFVATSDTDTLGNGRFSFKNISAGRYYVIVDSATMPPEHNYNALKDQKDVWAEQTYGPKGALCDDGNGSTVILSSAGACYGGRRAGVSDDLSSLSGAEHVAVVDLSGTDVTDLDFGFSFNVVTHTKDNDDDAANPRSAQGSLRQFIDNANAITGANAMRFVPMTPPDSGTWWRIAPQSALPQITDSDTIIDGTAYNSDGSVRDENPGTVGSGGTVLGTGADGVTGTSDEPTLTAFDKKELEIDLQHNYLYGIAIHNNGIANVTIRNLAIYGAKDDTDNTDFNADILVDEGASGIDIFRNFVGLRADGSLPANTSDAHGIVLIQDSDAITGFAIHHNYVGYIGGQGIWVTGHTVSNGKIYQNETLHANRLCAWLADGISAENGAEYITIYENYAHDNNGPGFESWEAKGHITWRDNTSKHNGYNPDSNPNGIVEKYGLRSMGSDNLIIHNHITGNAGQGVLVSRFEDDNTTALRSTVTQNSIYQNGTIAIDLDQTHGGGGENPLGDGITPNNGTKDAGMQNEDMDYPIFTYADLVGNTLTLSGYIGAAPDQSIFADATVEIYKVDDDGDGNGEGRWYLGSCTSDSNGNITGCNITTSLLAGGDYITATATDGSGNSSEFGPNQEVVASVPYTCDSNAYIFYSDDDNSPTQVNEIDLVNATKRQLSSDIYPVNINGIGYSVVDNFIWGYDIVNHLVTRTDSNLQTIAYKIDGLDPYGFHIGDVSTDGILYLASAYLLTEEGVESDGILRLYRVDVNPSSATYLQKLSEVTLDDQSLYAADFAFHPGNNKIYLVERFSGHIFEIDPETGHVTDVGDAGLGKDVDSHVQFFDKNGYFYFYYNGAFYRCDLTNPNKPDTKAKKFINMTLPSNGDGARCAYASMGDKPVVEISDASVTEGHNGTKSISFTIVSDRNITDTTGLAIDYATSDGSALAGSDYTAASGTVTMAQGSSAVTLTLPIIRGDLDIENDEDFFVTISSPDGYFLDNTAHAVIVNDDFNITINAVTTGSPFVDGNLTTQVVNRSFPLMLGVYNETLGKVVTDMNITKVDLIDPLGNLYTNLFTGAATTGSDGIVMLNVTVPAAYREAQLRITGDYMGRSYSSRSSDDFAIRPKAFSMTIPQNNIAGDPFAITLQATDNDGNPATGYNETIGTSFNINFTEQKQTTCTTGTMNLSGIAFSDGNASHTTSYSEAGMLDFDLSEIAGSEYAHVDADDTPDAERYISAAQVNDVNFSVDWIEIGNIALHNGSTTFTYYAAPANMQQMAAALTMTLQARNAAGDIVKNYTAGCYAKDVVVGVVFDTNSTPTQQNSLSWQEDGNASHGQSGIFAFNGSVTDQNFVWDIPKEHFYQGENNSSVLINFGRSITTPKEPMRFTITKLTAVNPDNRGGEQNATTLTTDFYYGRLHASDYMAVGNKLDAKIFYEVYCDKCDRRNFFTLANGPESVDSIKWYQISNYNDGKSGFNNVTGTHYPIPVYSVPNPDNISAVTALSGISNNMDMITFEVPSEKLPFKDRIYYQPEPWLIYKGIDSNDNRHHFTIDLSNIAKTWAGKGDTGMTVDLNVSGRKGGMKIDW